MYIAPVLFNLFVQTWWMILNRLFIWTCSDYLLYSYFTNNNKLTDKHSVKSGSRITHRTKFNTAKHMPTQHTSPNLLYTTKSTKLKKLTIKITFIIQSPSSTATYSPLIKLKTSHLKLQVKVQLQIVRLV